MDSSKSSKEKAISVSGNSSTDRDRLDFIKDIILPILRKREYAAPFLKPVDARKRNHRDYYFVITHPMDLGIIRDRLKTHFYKTSEECIADFQQIFKNATRYYSKRCVAHRFAKSLEKAWNGMLRAMPKIEIDNRKRVCKPIVKCTDIHPLQYLTSFIHLSIRKVHTLISYLRFCCIFAGADKTGDNNSNKRSSSKAHRGKKKSTKQDDIINVVGESISFAGRKGES
ncbi:unnamed protein product [Orchesella dallaii]|uniref:Bromo domain-containing protein n=1 Tax=Orchesella dallaii TaxID=48710 RepID=A0ABP1R618_9HEXA